MEEASASLFNWILCADVVLKLTVEFLNCSFCIIIIFVFTRCKPGRLLHVYIT